MLVRDRMSSPAVTLRSDEDYQAALRLMQTHTWHHVPVVDAQGRLVGIAAERDLVVAAARYLQSSVEVSEVMHRGAVTATPDMPLAAAAKLMLEHRIGSLPVLDAEQRLVGLITETDVLRAFVELTQEREASAIQALA